MLCQLNSPIPEAAAVAVLDEEVAEALMWEAVAAPTPAEAVGAAWAEAVRLTSVAEPRLEWVAEPRLEWVAEPRLEWVAEPCREWVAEQPLAWAAEPHPTSEVAPRVWVPFLISAVAPLHDSAVAVTSRAEP